MKAFHPINPLQSGSESLVTKGVTPLARHCALNAPIATPDPEVAEKKKRRKFTAAYKRSIVEQANRCHQAGEIGALLRREGLYSSHLVEWRRQY